MLMNGGAKARGALLRDVSAYLISVVTITALLWRGHMSYVSAASLLILYVAFIFIVLGADLWHIFTRSELCVVLLAPIGPCYGFWDVQCIQPHSFSII